MSATSPLNLESIIALINFVGDNKSKKLTFDKRYYDEVYSDKHVAIYQIQPNEFVIYNKDLDKSMCFDLSAKYYNVTTENGDTQEFIDDIFIKLDGDTIMKFDGDML